MTDDVARPAPSEADLAPPERRRRTGLMLLVAAIVLAVDQLTKWWAVDRLVRGNVDVIGSLRFRLAYNTGTAFSIGSGRGIGPLVAPLAMGIVVALVLLGGTARRAVGAVAAGLIIGGALGNLGDRAFRGDSGFLHGAVIDFVDLQWWPIFNVADSAIVVGAFLLAFISFQGDRGR